GLLASTAIGVFETSRLPVLFVLALPEMLVAFRLGWLGTQLGIVLLALIGSIMTAHGFGPISLASHDAPTRALFFQFFLATQVLLILPVVASLAASASVLNALRESEQSVQLLAEEAAVLLLGFAADGTCLKVVGNVGAMLGIGERALLGRDLGALSPINRTPLLELYAQALAQPETVLSLEFSSPLRPGRWLEANLRAPETLAGPQGSSVLVVLQDVTDRHDAQLALLRAAETDELTGLLNRAAFMSRLEAALRDERATRIHLAIFDVDRFKVINDSAGHAMGNAVLQAVAERMAGAVCAPDLLCRMGGDEFLLMLECASLAEAETRCQAVLNALHGQPIDLPTGDTLSVRVSCGLAGGGRGQSSEQMLHRADAAVYAAKRAGRNRIAAVA
ncbi:MAG TPA: diguanylate cyclase, partial [Novosphingobium sp.]|nr:diguanylate cyclase [Novosphingobium sp.]